MFKRIYFFFITYLIAMTLSQSFLVLWYVKNGVGFEHLVGSFVAGSVVALAILFFFTGEMRAKKAIFIGTLASMLSVISVIWFYHVWQLYLSSLIAGFNIVLFWSTYNTMHFKFRLSDQKGFSSGMLFLLSPILSIFLLPFAGFLAERFGFRNLFIVGALSYLIPLFVSIRYLPDFQLNFNIRQELAKTGFDYGTFFQGVGMRINYSLIPVYTLFFINTPFCFGSFFAYLSVMTVVASLINSHISDRIKNRRVFLYVFSILSAISFTMLAFAQNTETWQLYAAISNLCFYLAVPFWLVATLDHYESNGVGEKKMMLREFFLNLGYIFALGCVVVIYKFTSNPSLGLGFVSILTLFLPLSVYLQRTYRKNNK